MVATGTRTLHVITAVTRPENLARIAGALAFAGARTRFAISWHWRFDLDHESIGGQAVKNAILDELDGADGFVWILDDDTLAISTVLQRVEAELDRDPSLDAVIVSQFRNDPRRILPAGPEFATVGHIDIGQAFLSRELVGDERIPESYEGDGHFLATVLAGANAAYLREPLSIHNALR